MVLVGAFSVIVKNSLMVRLKLYIEETEGGEVSVEMVEEDKDDEVGLSVGGGIVAAIVLSLVAGSTLLACLITFYYRRVSSSAPRMRKINC